jgi:3-deoxy-D-manno-octulosonic-acid transferase
MKAGQFLFNTTLFCYSTLLDFIRITLFTLLHGYAKSKGWDLDRRQKLPTPLRDFRGCDVVWLHAASLGEAKLLVRFYEMLHQRHSDDLYLVTATTRTGVAYLEKLRLPKFCAVGFLPIDTISQVTRIINHFTVKRLWLLETEIWPSLLAVCVRRNIPVGIVNGRMETASFAWYRRFSWIIRRLFASVDVILAQSDAYAERFTSFGIAPESVHVVGNIKGHIRIQRPARKEWLSVRRRLNIGEEAFVVTAGCLHAGEGVVLRAFRLRMDKLGYPCKVIVVPRYLKEAVTIVEELGGNVVHFDDIATSRRWEVCVIEKMGILDEMYKIADAAVIGGTFVDIGGHSMWDAARYGIPVFFGSHYHTQQKSGEILTGARVGFPVTDGEALAEAMYRVMKKEPMQFLQAQKAFIEEMNKTRSVIEPLLP